MTTEIPNKAEREQYTKDMLEYASPWRKWEYRRLGKSSNSWRDCIVGDMHFATPFEYRRKPDTITIAGREVVKPIKANVWPAHDTSDVQCIIECATREEAQQMAAALTALMEGSHGRYYEAR